MKLLEVIDDNVLLSPIERSEKDEGSLIIQPNRVRQPIYWTVVLVGPGVFKQGDVAERIPMNVQQGDVVMIGSQLDGVEVVHEEVKCRMVKQHQILAKVEIK